MLRCAPLVLALWVPAAAWAETCPPGPNIIDAETAIYDRIREAPDAATAAPLGRALWALWTRAPDDRAQTMLRVGMSQLRAGAFDQARTTLTALIAYCPDFAEGYNQRAFAAFLQQDYDPALADLDRALARSPRHMGALTGKVMTLMGMGRTALAQDVVREAIVLNPWIRERALLPEDERL
ncbi:MAG: tetratricopeptide repeat protein [Shimia sp.]